MTKTARAWSRGLRLATLLVVASLVAGACGARWTDEQAASVITRNAGPNAATPGVATGASGDRGASTGDTPAAGEPSDVGAGGQTGAPHAGGDAGAGAADPAAGGRAATAALACAAPSDAPGVTEDTIVIGTINSLSGPVPGLAASALAAARAQVAYRNANGGVCGRKIVLKEGDDGTDNGRYRSVLTELQDDVFGIAGGFALGDAGSTELIAASGIPIVNAPSAQTVADLPTVVDIVPNAAASARYRYIRDNGGTKVSLTYLAVDQSRFEANLQRKMMEAAGIQVVQVQELPISTLSYDSAARSAVNSGANYLFFIGDANSNIKMTRAVADTGHDFAFFELFTFAYGSPSFLDGAGSAADGAVTWLRVLPNEDPNPEVRRYNEWMGRVAPHEPRDTFASDSWAAANAFFENLEALPGPITREAFLAQVRSVDTYDANGFFGRIRLGQEVADGCTVGMQVQSGEWKRLTPSEGFLC